MAKKELENKSQSMDSSEQKVKSSLKQYFSFIDIAKAIGIFLVILGHMQLRECKGDLYHYIYSFHMPFFFLLSGFVFNRYDQKNYLFFLKKKFFSILVPYLFFGIISIIIFQFVGSSFIQEVGISTSNYSLKQMFLNLLWGSPANDRLQFNQPLWFLTCLFAVENIFWWINKLSFLQLFKDKSTIFFSLFIIVFIVLNITLREHHFVCDLPFCLVSVPWFILFFITGVILRPFLTISFIQKHRWGILFGSIVLITSGIFLYFVKTRMFNESIFTIPMTYCLAWISSLGYLALSCFVFQCRPIEFIGKCTLVIMCVQKFPVAFFQSKCQLTRRLLVENNLVAVYIISLTTLFLCVFCAIIVKRWFPFMIGRSYKK